MSTPESELIHAGTHRTAGAPVVPPLVPASIFVAGGYGRNGNPTWEALEQAVGTMESAKAVVFASGQAASMALVLALARPRLVLPSDGYYNMRTLAELLPGVQPVHVDLLDLPQVQRALGGAPAVLW